MIRRWRPKLSFPPSNVPPIVGLYLFHPATNPAGDTNPQKSYHFKPETTTNWRQDANRTIPKLTVVTPQTVLTTLYNCTSDLIALSFFIWCAKQPHFFHDKEAFRHMVSVATNLTNRHATVRAIIGELEAIGCSRKAQTFLLLMRIYWYGDMYDMVLESFQEMYNYGYVPNAFVRNIVMDVLFKTGRVDDAMKVLEETQVPNFLSFNIAICNLSRLNDADNVKIVLRRMLRRGFYMNPETHTLVLNCLCKAGRLEGAFQLLGMMIVLGLPISVNSWSILIDQFCKLGMIDFATYLLMKMVKIDCSPNIVTYTTLIKGFLQHQELEKAFEMIALLESKGCFPDLVHCNVLIDCLSKMGRYNEAFKIFTGMGKRGLTPDLVAYNCLLSNFCKAGHPEVAIEFYNDMLDRGVLPDKYSFSLVLSALCQLGRIKEAVDVYRGILWSSADIDAHVHTVIIDGLIKSGRLPLAMKIFTDAANTGKSTIDVVTYGVAIGGLIGGREVKRAYALFNQMKEVNIMPNELVYNLMLFGFCKSGDANMANRLLQEMADQNIEIDRRTYQVMHDLPCTSSKSRLVPYYSLDVGTSSSDDFSDLVAAVG